MTTNKVEVLTDDDHAVIGELAKLGREGNIIATDLLAHRYEEKHLDQHEVWATARAVERRRTQAEAAERDAEQRRISGLRGQSRVLEILKRGAGV